MRLSEEGSAEVAGDHELLIDVGDAHVWGRLELPRRASATVLLANASGVRRRAWRDRFIASALGRVGLATLLLDLLTLEEDSDRPELRQDVPLLARRLLAATDWLTEEDGPLPDMPLGYLCEGTTTAAALVVAALRPGVVHAVFSREGRPDLSGASLRLARVPTLLLVSGDDDATLAANRSALALLPGDKRLEIVEGRLDPDAEAALATAWFIPRLG